MSQNEKQTSAPSSPNQTGGGSTGQRQGVGVDWVRNNQEPREQTKGN
ncbi:hypothetical protein [Vibrio harveyi]|nr:hypothetical protein [Vibrio harveyi]MCQ9072061.1 hypothetical protein [Vibrio harveyi]WHP65172.1 hypothetical protein QMY49_24290 [Vibrio harveyi]HDM8132074.1 hypothetical protein [Vibrio harveyi]